MENGLISLIIATIHRVEPLTRLLCSLEGQTYKNFEVIIVDQNLDSRLVPVLKRFQKRFPLFHLRSEPGLSRARNVGLTRARGQVVGFPDDDCWYPPDLLEKVALFFEHRSWDGVLGKPLREEAFPSDLPFVSAPRLDSQPLNRFNLTMSIDIATMPQALRPRPSVPNTSFTLFVKKSVLAAIGDFDETLGLGANTLWGSGEEVDLTVRCLKAGFRLAYCPQIQVFHPDPKRGYHDLKRGFLYGAGLGRVLRKHGYPFWFVLYHWSRSLAAAGLSWFKGDMGKFQYQWATFRGKMAGWLSRAPLAKGNHGKEE